MAGTFAGFESYRLNGVRLTEEEFGRGSYAVVLRLEYRGLACAGKQLYPVLYEQGVGDTVCRFEVECRLLAQMRHPNIVQFIGVYFEEGSRVPILVMEFLPTTLARCIDTYGVLPEEVSYSILYDVALGLYHLHSQTPPIVHRDLSADNVLLTPNMTAKISDLGVARILNLTPQQMSHMTCTPGTPSYMPPEAMRANPRYDARIDQFSYGVLMIHVLSGRWPLPLCEPTYVNPENRAQLLAVSEAERRDEYLRDIGNAHPLMELILRCVSNDPGRRATAAQMVERMKQMTRHNPPAFPNRVEMLQLIRADATEKGSLREEIETFTAEYEQSRLEREELIQQHEADVEQIRTEMRAQNEAKMRTQNETHQAEMRAQNESHQAEMRAQKAVYEAEMRAQNKIHEAEMRANKEIHEAKVRAQNEFHEAEMRAQNEAHRAEVEQVCNAVTELKAQNTTAQTRLRREIRGLEELVQRRQEEIKRFKEVHSLEIEQIRLQLGHIEALQSELESQNETFQTRLKFENEVHLAQCMAQIEAREQERRAFRSKLEALETELMRVRKVNQNLQATVVSKDKEIQSKDGDILVKRAEILAHQEEAAKMMSENGRLQVAILSKVGEIESKQQEVHVLNQELSAKNELIAAMSVEIAAKEAAVITKDATFAQKNAVLKRQFSTIRGLTDQLTKATELLLGQELQPHPLHPQAKITWEPCRDLPVKMTSAQTVVIRDMIYCGSGGAAADDDEYRVFCYSPSENTWKTLPDCNVCGFGLGQVRGKLTTVGGIKKSKEVTNRVCEFDEMTQSWKQSIPPMPTARYSPAVLNHHSTMAVAGGHTGYGRTSIVEVFREETSQWHVTEPLPFPWWKPSSLLINNRWYLLGGAAEGEDFSNRAVYAHIDLLLQKAFRRDQEFTDRNSAIKSAWEVLPNTPYYRSAAATFGTSLLAVGGTTSHKWSLNMHGVIAVHVYSPCTNAWIHISDLPVPRMDTTTAMLSPTELLVIGGRNVDRQNLVFKGLLRLE